jgi:oligopeptide transport system ATP-binding protein
MNETAHIIDVSGLSVAYHRPAALLSTSSRISQRVLNDLSFSVQAGDCLGIVGESGSGKTTLAKALLGLVPVTAGQVRFQTGLDKRHDVQFIYQDPLSALNPRMTVEQLITEPLDYVTNKVTTAECLQKLKTVMEQVGLDYSQRHRYAHEFSGGQCQRIGIARAMITCPRILICDEPVSALDVSVRAQIINLLQDLQRQLNLSLIFIAHDLSLVRYISNKLLVLYQGKLMEYGDTKAIFRQPRHPYTQALINAEPQPDPEKEKQRLSRLNGRLMPDIEASGNVPDQGCVYGARCEYRQAQCLENQPALQPCEQTHHKVACFFPFDTKISV